jgi:hypothetical protein
MRTIILAAAMALLLAAPLRAQAPSPAASARPAPPRPETTWEPVEQPMDALLNAGWRIVAMTGPGFTLEQRGKYLFCELRPPGGLRGNGPATSECHRMN